MRICQFPGKQKFCQLAKEINIVPVCAEILAEELIIFDNIRHTLFGKSRMR